MSRPSGQSRCRRLNPVLERFSRPFGHRHQGMLVSMNILPASRPPPTSSDTHILASACWSSETTLPNTIPAVLSPQTSPLLPCPRMSSLSCHCFVCPVRHGLSKPLSGQRPETAWETWPGSQEMFSTTRHEGFGFLKQNTAGWTAADSGVLILSQISCMKASGQNVMGLA